MATGHIFLLGAIAGATIFLGMPIGRMRLGAQSRAALSALATGILLFLLWDVLTGAVEPITAALDARHWGRFSWLAALGAGGFALGLLALVYYSEWMKARAGRRATPLVGPGAAALDEFENRTWLDSLTPGKQLALLIAVGIGLHNATEGFGICGPMAGEGTRPTWGFLAVLGLIGGGPTFLGTVLGQAWSSDAVSVIFFAVAAGSILYVVQELFAVNRRYGHTKIVMWLVFAGIVAGFATDFVVSASGV